MAPTWGPAIVPPVVSEALKDDYEYYGRKAGIIIGVTIGLFALTYGMFKLRHWGRWRIGRPTDASHPYPVERWIQT